MGRLKRFFLQLLIDLVCLAFLLPPALVTIPPAWIISLGVALIVFLPSINIYVIVCAYILSFVSMLRCNVALFKLLYIVGFILLIASALFLPALLESIRRAKLRKRALNAKNLPYEEAIEALELAFINGAITRDEWGMGLCEIMPSQDDQQSNKTI